MTEKDSDTEEYSLYDLHIETIAHPEGKPFVCNHPIGSWFELRGENIHFPAGQPFPLYPLAALLPILPAKQRETDAADWMTTDSVIACPDPHCGGRFKITRIGKRRFRHSETSAVPLFHGKE